MIDRHRGKRQYLEGNRRQRESAAARNSGKRPKQNLKRAWTAVLAALSLALAACSAVFGEAPTPTPERPPRIAFMSDRDGNFEIYLMEANGSNPVNLTNNPAADGVPDWSVASNAFLFLSDRMEGQLGVYQMGIQGENPRVIDTDPPPAASQPYWSPSGDQVIYQSGDPEATDLYLSDIGESSITNLTNSAGVDRFANWAPDGERYLFTSTRDGSIAIYVMGIGDQEAIRLTDPTFGSAFPAWSPDGSQIAFASDQDQDVNIYLMDADGSNLTQLTSSAGFDGYPAWSPDGSKIAFTSNRDDNGEIYIMNPDGSEQTNLTNTPNQESLQGDFSWSPDGKRILFHSDRDGNVEVYVMDADGGNPVNLTNNPANDFASIWVP